MNGTDCEDEGTGGGCRKMTDNKMLTQPRSIMDTGCSNANGLSRQVHGWVAQVAPLQVFHFTIALSIPAVLCWSLLKAGEPIYHICTYLA